MTPFCLHHTMGTPSRLITTFVNNGINKHIQMLGNCKNFHSHGYTCWNKVACCSHAWIHTLGSPKLIITITFRQIEVGNLGSWPNNTYGEKNERKTCQMKLYPITSHGICKSQSWVWPFWNQYFYKLCFIVYTIHLINLFISKWSHEVVWWLINAFSHNFWNSLWNTMVGEYFD